MTEITDKNWTAMSDTALIGTIGAFIKQQRLAQNKTQSQLAKEAGINRDTLSSFENGVSSNLMTFVQLLRALKLLHLLQSFKVKQQISPIQLAKLEKKGRMRARNTNSKEKKSKSDW
ncbi:MAG: helix-turn-helix transcriptional regulator [Bacteroidales bacterium]|jgi:transcriptional regulator with XRE-family HTH domain|nr:helix-turn-helix transcriptional regulator [Bacteroidales bacterium]